MKDFFNRYRPWILWGLLGIAVILVAIFLASCKEGDIPFTMSSWEREARNALNHAGIGDEYTNFKHDYTTPKGMKVKSVVPVPSDFLVAADEGATLQVERFRAMFPEWQPKPLPETTILIVHPNRITIQDGSVTPPCFNEFTEPGSPCIYAQGQRASGMMIGHDDRWEDIDVMTPIVMPHQVEQGWRFRQYWVNTVHNEREHVDGWKNRMVNPTGVFYHFVNTYENPNADFHPWQWGEQKGFVSRPSERWYCLTQ
jgi:hypothetical protein